jgi:hypothetical protein
MISRLTGTALLLSLLAGATPAAAPAEPEAFVPEVYRTPDLSIRAGIAMHEGRVVELGDVLALVVVVSWNGAKVQPEEPGDAFFTDAWPKEAGPVLLGRTTEPGTPAGAFTEQRRHVFRFQVVGCPDAELTCPGNRRYGVPEFTLRYRTDAGEGGEVATFRPEPRSLTIATSIARNEDGRLHPFSTYFPTGAYPEPLSAPDRTRASLATIGIGLVMLIGGVLMWPFRFRDRNPFAAKDVPRWQQLLRELPAAGSEDPARLAEQMRRCLVWYLSDELGIDAFDWLDGEAGRQPDAHAPLRELFIDLLHDPSGRAEALRSRLTGLLAAGA